MAALVKAIHPRLKEVGFRKRRHTFNRSVEPGVIQVINFQMGQKLPPGTRPIPPFRPNLHGRFTVNLGVAIEEAWLLNRRGQDVTFPDFLNEYDCDIRERLGQILGERKDVWWKLPANPNKLATRIGDTLLHQGAAWLDSRATRERILQIWEKDGLAALPSTTALPLVMILRHLDRSAQAEQALRSYYDTITVAAHQQYVHDLAEELGVDLARSL